MAAFDFILAVSLAVGGGLVGWAYLMLSSTPADFRAARICLSLAFVIVLVSDFIWGFMTETPFPLRALIVGTVGAAISIGLVEALRWVNKKEAAQAPQPSQLVGQGGAGGSAKVGGSGLAVGGSGGAAGRYGVGGAGGSGEVSADGIAVGGAGGSAGEKGIWRAPAKSGYEILQRRLGQPVDPVLRQFGRGGPGAGYQQKLVLVESLRQEYFGIRAETPKSVFESIDAVPLDYINRRLAEKGEPWRTRIVEDEYEFYIPHN